jgi:hypothetical protein
MPNIQKCIKNQDKFGYFVSLSFNSEGSSHKTVIGGIISILISCLYTAYIGYYLYIMSSNIQP